jgi:hypothetical protein
MVESAATVRARWVPMSVSRNRDMRASPLAESAFGGGGGEAAIAGAWGAAAAASGDGRRGVWAFRESEREAFDGSF